MSILIPLSRLNRCSRSGCLSVPFDISIHSHRELFLRRHNYTWLVLWKNTGLASFDQSTRVIASVEGRTPLLD